MRAGTLSGIAAESVALVKSPCLRRNRIKAALPHANPSRANPGKMTRIRKMIYLDAT